MSRILTTTQAAEHFGVNTKTIRRWIQSGKLKGERIDNRWHVRIEDNDGHDHDPERGSYTTQPLQTQLEQAQKENALLRLQLTEKDNQLARRDVTIESLIQQLDHSQQLLAMQTKTTAALTEQLDAERQMLEDMRRQSWWKRLVRLTSELGHNP